jgi:trigger factor
MELPENLVAQETEGMVSNTKMNLQRSGLSIEAMGLSEAKLRDDYRPEAERRIKTALILEKIAVKESIEADENDVAGQVMEIARRAGQTPEIVREIYSKNNMMESLKEGIAADKTLNFVIENATIEDIEPVEASPAEAGEGSL